LGVKRLKSKGSTDMLGRSYSTASTPSLLNGSGDGKAVSSVPGTRASNDLASLRSPPHSRSSSAQDSYSTSATTFEDNEEKRGRDEGDIEEEIKKRDSGKKEKEGKGNVLVSVRVRPDAGGDKTSGKDWLVDGRQSLVAYRGREGGDYYYGTLCSLYGSLMFTSLPQRDPAPVFRAANHEIVQTTYLRLTIKIIKSTMPVRNGSYVVLWKAIMGLCLLMV
jgi:hypothetical protein